MSWRKVFFAVLTVFLSSYHSYGDESDAKDPIESKLIELELNYLAYSTKLKNKHPAIVELLTQKENLQSNPNFKKDEYRKFALMHLAKLMIERSGMEITLKEKHPKFVILNKQIEFLVKQSKPLSLKKDLNLIQPYIHQIIHSLEKDEEKLSGIYREKHPEIIIIRAKKQKARKFLISGTPKLLKTE